MNNFLSALIVAVLRAVLSNPAAMALIAELFRRVWEPRIIEPSKPNADDDAFIHSARDDGWGSEPE